MSVPVFVSSSVNGRAVPDSSFPCAVLTGRVSPVCCAPHCVGRRTTVSKHQNKASPTFRRIIDFASLIVKSDEYGADDGRSDLSGRKQICPLEAATDRFFGNDDRIARLKRGIQRIPAE